ncbi:MAG: chemotaxis response regulator protein-glutamate methylesterase [Gammaproteobacteria bacterium]|nr:chemotaxis response regulator protein-glutamate methylesterase [Gammaproteobacteria bacterium]MBU1646148.1 chemotaxis response regulator protein-glutamate methylesterase [Gammaproteobacteria bacterium]MBU1972210.1 chemotaxis response regulator protein-glutamate methylesterase [Gammaproteobacteria bacterium]
MAIKVLIVDDSALMRALLTEIIGGAPDLNVVGSAPDPIAAREMIKALNPDVLTLDVEMPKMDGLEFLTRIMRLRPMPVVMISSLTEKGSDVTLKALETGAVDFVAKPRAESASQLLAYADDIRDKIRAAFGARLRDPVRGARAAAVAPAPTFPSGSGISARVCADHLIAIGASTGGTEAIKDVLAALPTEMPGIVMAQHMPEGFTNSFARRLDTLTNLTVVEAQGGERIQPGHAYLAPGHSHLLVRRSGTGFVTELSQSDPVNRHRPSVDVLFRSVAREARDRASGVILTGMGKDGALGLLEMREKGAWTIGQDEASCVVYGMPREAANIGALAEVVALRDIPGHLLARLRRV